MCNEHLRAYRVVYVTTYLPENHQPYLKPDQFYQHLLYMSLPQLHLHDIFCLTCSAFFLAFECLRKALGLDMLDVSRRHDVAQNLFLQLDREASHVAASAL
jgi:hypothetical protein